MSNLNKGSCISIKNSQRFHYKYQKEKQTKNIEREGMLVEACRGSTIDAWVVGPSSATRYM